MSGMDNHIHKVIWLQPWCDGCEKHCNSGEGRLWCQDDVWGQCDECDRKPVKYIIAAAPASTAGEVGK
jgi:hypothetical protein